VPALSADVAVIGGTGFYTFLDDAVEHPVETPYGDPSAPIAVGTVAGRSVAFLPRHGKDHQHPPHAINYRANLWALRSLGVRQVLAPCAVGALSHDLAPGDLVIPDQLVDRTHRRVSSYVESGACHLPFADPYCSRLGDAVVAAAPDVKADGTMVVIEGPRFSTRAESKMFTQLGGDVIGMTQFPEVTLARELEICFANVALVTDFDVGVDDIPPVSHAEVLRVFSENIDGLRELLVAAIPRIPDERTCPCATALQGTGDD
jgi:5'-methylthioadenosine phosphorylase